MVSLLLLLLLPFLAVPAVLSAQALGRRAAALVAGAAMLGGLALLLGLAPSVFAGQTLLFLLDWLPDWGLNLNLRLDGLGFLFALLVYGIGALIILYAYYYMPGDDRLGRFLGTLLAFAGGMLGVVLAENILFLLLAWEVTSLTSFLLIAYKHRYAESRLAARLALLVTGGGGLALLAGLLLLGRMAGSFELSVILDRGDLIRGHALYVPALLLVLLGAFTKSAQFPFHIWLPQAMAAPTPVSAYLHSATMVKAGVFLLARLYPALAGTETWFLLVTGTGAATMLLGAYLALIKHDFKGLLAYSTISHLGLITTLLGLDTAMSAIAAVFHIINHAIFKASLFMVAGVIDKQCGTRDMRRVNGLARTMPVTATLGIVAAASMAGVPFLNGFLSKEMFFAETVAHPGLAGFGRYFLPAVATLAGILGVAYSLRFAHDVFFNGEPHDLPRTPTEPPRFMRLPMEILAALVVLVGVAPQVTVGPLLEVVAGALLQATPPPYTLAVWHGLNAALVMSVVAVGGGILWYMGRGRLFALHDRLPFDLAPTAGLERLVEGLGRGAHGLLARLDRQLLRQWVGLFLGAALLLGPLAWWLTPGGGGALSGPLSPGAPPDLPTALGVAALVAGALATAMAHRHRLRALMAASVAGLGAVVLFTRFGAPDLALTQAAVEIVTLVVLLLALTVLPRTVRPDLAAGPQRLNLALAAGVGAGFAALVYAMLGRPYQSIAGYHVAAAKPLGGGTNVVNVILVDFRGFDTLGEIAVLAMAGLGILSLLAGLRPPNGAARPMRLVMLEVAMRVLWPLAIVVTLHLFLRGHNLPGGGFVAGLVLAIALLLRRLSGNVADLSRWAAPLMGGGLLVALATGAGAWLFGRPFLTSAFAYPALPLLGKVGLTSAALFDLGILLLVAGTLIMAFEALARATRPLPATEA
jgi:multicomponent K+:H+ antiporter subunit A